MTSMVHGGAEHLSYAAPTARGEAAFWNRRIRDHANHTW